MVTKRSHIIKQTCRFHPHVCLSMCGLFVTTRHERVKIHLFSNLNTKKTNDQGHRKVSDIGGKKGQKKAEKRALIWLEHALGFLVSILGRDGYFKYCKRVISPSKSS